MQSSCCLCASVSSYTIQMAQRILMKLGMNIMASEPISAYFTNPSHQSVSLHACLPVSTRQRLSKIFRIVSRQRLSKNVTAAIFFNPILFASCTCTFSKQTKNKQTPWSESASELYRPSDRRMYI
jgi:hypothetical protein